MRRVPVALEQRDTSKCFELLLGRKSGQIIQQRAIPAVVFHRTDLDDQSIVMIAYGRFGEQHASSLHISSVSRL